MNIGVPKESKTKEGRVGLVPAACSDLMQRGHMIFVESNAGLLSGYTNDQYIAHGCQIVDDFKTVCRQSELIVKVKEPSLSEVECLTRQHTLFCYLHLAALPELTDKIKTSGATAVAFETVTDTHGRLPLLAPMSKIAGKLAIQNAAVLLHHQNQGSGRLLGGVSATDRTHVVVLGCGSAGIAATELAAHMGARVTAFDKVIPAMDTARSLGANVTALYPYKNTIEETIATADVLVGAVLIPGAKAPKIVSREMVRMMQSGSVIVDIAIDQGGCIETIKPTTYDQPTFIDEGVIHFGVTNMPGAVPRTASEALSAAIAPYVEQLTQPNWRTNRHLCDGINVENGCVVHEGLKASLQS